MTDQEDQPRPLPIAEAYTLRLCLICGADLPPISEKVAPCPVCQLSQHFCNQHQGLAGLRWDVEIGQRTDWPRRGILHIRRMCSELGPVRELTPERAELQYSVTWKVEVAVLLASLEVQFEVEER